MKTSAMTDAEIREAGWEALIEKLGPAGALRFALQTERGSGDYAALRDQLLGAASVDDLVARIRQANAASESKTPEPKAPARRRIKGAPKERRRRNRPAA